MDIQAYIDHKKKLQNYLLTFLESSEKDDFEILFGYIRMQNYHRNKNEFEHFLYLLSNISNNHHRYSNFIRNINGILFCLKNLINKLMSNLEIYQTFKYNKSILLFLVEKEILIFDEIIMDALIHNPLNITNKYYLFFYPEIKDYICKNKKKELEKNLLDENPNIFKYFEENRKIGENDSYICSLIRNDNVDEFIQYINRSNINLSSTIPSSIFETNLFLIDKKPTLIEYAAFYGSIQIFQYLRFNNVEIDSSLWLYVIHSKNAEMIHLLEEINVKPPCSSYEQCIIESIKCHHNDIANYFKNNSLSYPIDNNLKNALIEKVFECAFQYSNYSYFPSKINADFLFYYLYSYKYFTVANIIMDDINKYIPFFVKPILTFEEAIKQKKTIFMHYLLSKKTEIDSKTFNNTNISKITIPQSITKIGSHAFYGCISLKYIMIPSSVTSIGPYAFYGCMLLEQITISSSITTIEESLFSQCQSLNEVILPSSITTIKYGAFSRCSSLKFILIPNSVKSIGDFAFHDCTSLTNIFIPNSVISIGSDAFSGTSLKEINLPQSLTSIGDSAFEKCILLNQINIPNSVTSIGSYAFSGCKSLKSIVLPSKLTSIKSYSFNNCINLNQLNIPNSVTSIDDGAFYGCCSIKIVNLTFGLLSIGDCAFYNCKSITNMNFPNSILTIGYRAFQFCSSLTKVYVPPSITNIAYDSFLYCSSLQKITLPNKLQKSKNDYYWLSGFFNYVIIKWV